ncbi:MAG TPA: hypothetical protein VLF93_08005 [Candidatus Saccharimonadales bacterium]|nr:hypothetical protein [Candidatus Saccharimonadales bacterium]
MGRGTPLIDEEDLIRRTKRDNYHIRRVIKIAVLIFLLFIGTVITGGFISTFVLNSNFRSEILDTIKSNFQAIILAGLYILGIRVFNTGDDEK